MGSSLDTAIRFNEAEISHPLEALSREKVNILLPRKAIEATMLLSPYQLSFFRKIHEPHRFPLVRKISSSWHRIAIGWEHIWVNNNVSIFIWQISSRRENSFHAAWRPTNLTVGNVSMEHSKILRAASWLKFCFELEGSKVYFISRVKQHSPSIICVSPCDSHINSHQDDVRDAVLAREIGKFGGICVACA